MLLRYYMPSRALPDARSDILLGDDDNELAIHLSLCDTTSLRMPVRLRRLSMCGVHTNSKPRVTTRLLYRRSTLHIVTRPTRSASGEYENKRERNR